ncbi:hypothetical protein [Yoonia sp.]|uniref:hypothetical protein n=1 Tax=Yoonia sp. TaxID=2212373 RepID=UPI0035C8287F
MSVWNRGHFMVAAAKALALILAVIGGGGDIVIMAGLSGLFAPGPTFLAIMIAVSPVPAAIYLFGA